MGRWWGEEEVGYEGRGWEVWGSKGEEEEEEEARYGEEGGRAWVGEVSDLHILLAYSMLREGRS